MMMMMMIKEDRQILNSIWQRKHRWIDYVLRHDGLPHELEGRVTGKPTRGRRRILMLHDLANDDGYMLHSNGQLRTERYGDTEKGCQNLLYSKRLLIIKMMMPTGTLLLYLYMACMCCVVNDDVDRRYMQIRYQFIGDLDAVIVDKAITSPNLPMSALYGMSVLYYLLHVLCPQVVSIFMQCFMLLVRQQEGNPTSLPCQGSHIFININLFVSRVTEKTTWPIFTKFSAHEPWKKPLDCGGNPDHITLQSEIGQGYSYNYS